MPTRSLRWQWTCFCTPSSTPKNFNWPQQQDATAIVRRNDEEAGIAEREGSQSWSTASTVPTRASRSWLPSAPSLSPDLKEWHDRTVGGKLGGGKLIVRRQWRLPIPWAMEAKLRAAFEPLPHVKEEPGRRDQFAGPKVGVYFIDKEDVNQSAVEILGIGIDRHNPDVPAIAVMNQILGGGFASRLFQKVRTELGLAYAVEGGISFAYDHPGTFGVARGSPKSASTVEATKAAFAEIASLTSTPFTQDELDRGKDNLLSSFLFRYDTREKVLASAKRVELLRLSARTILSPHKAASRKGATLADLDRVCKEVHIHPENYAVLVVAMGPKSSLDWTN